MAAPEQEEPPAQGPSSSPTHLMETPPAIIPLLPDHPFVGTPPWDTHSLSPLPALCKTKLDLSPSSSFGDNSSKRTRICSLEAEDRSEHSSVWGDEIMAELVLEAGPSTEHKGQEPASCPSSPTRSIADPDDRTVAGSSWNTRDQATLDSDSSRENLAVSNLDTASGDCITYSDTDEVPMQTACKNYQRSVRASCKLSKGNIWTEAQLKRINNSHQEMWGHDHGIIRSEQKCALAEDNNSFEIQEMMVRTDELLCITKATGSTIHTRESEAETHSQVRNLVLLLKQYHAHHYCFFK